LGFAIVPVLFLTADLVFSSRVVGVAKQIGRLVSVVASAKALVEKCDEEPGSLAIIDLSLPRLNAGDLLAQLRALPQPPRAVVAYAPHVHENLLAAAVEAGCTEVLTRGQFNSQIEGILAKYGPD
jgi:DNA-binding NarL/FixJ family response regulator